MAKTWVLDTETKGTGAHIVPLKSRARDGREKELAIVQLERPPRPPQAPAEEPHTRFRVIDVMSASVLGEDLDAEDAVHELANMRSALDARVYVRSYSDARWRLLSLADTRALWQLAHKE
jgi:hypothetical protein